MPNPYRIITYNILEGWRNDTITGRTLLPGDQRRQAAYTWLANQRPAVVGLQELCRFSAAQLATDAHQWNHPHSAFLDCGYSIGLTAASPIEVIEQKLDMHHGLLHARVDGIDFLVTHFTPHAERQQERRQEVAIILERAQTIQQAGRPCLLMGDLNALSPEDDALTGPASTKWYPSSWPLADGRPDYTTIQALLDGGLIDPWPHHRAPDTPPFSERPRYDFTLLSPDLAQRSIGAHYWQNGETGQWSDHWPVGVDLDWPPA